MESLSVTHPLFLILYMHLTNPPSVTRWQIIKVLLRQSKIPGEENSGMVWEDYKCGFPGLLNCYYTNTQTKFEEKGMALASEQNQETGTVANLYAADQANASVNRERD